MTRDYTPDQIATIDGMADRDQVQRALDDQFDRHLNAYPLEPGEKREVRFARWSKEDAIGGALLAKVVALTTAGRPAPGPVSPEGQSALRQKGAAMVDKAAEAVIADARKHGVTLSVEKARTMVRKVDRRVALAELGRIPEEEE